MCKQTLTMEDLTLRDWFAGQYLAGMITLMAGGGGRGGNIYLGVGSAGDSTNDDQGNREVQTPNKKRLAKEAYEVADAMIEARKLEP